MKFVLFYQSLISDWNHGNAHFLRGVVSELKARGHDVDVYEPDGGWSFSHLLAEQGDAAVADFHAAFPELSSHRYALESLDLEEALDGAQVVIVHEWNDSELIARVGEHASRSGCRALFHDTHHRSVTNFQALASLDLSRYDGVLAFGRQVAERYRQHGWAKQVWVWHEAADLRRFGPRPRSESPRDVVWIGNWGDDERSSELVKYLVDPVRRLGLAATVHGVRYPSEALHLLGQAGIRFQGWLANHRVPDVFAGHRCTVHVPRQAYTEQLPGIPTIRMFEALSCGIPLVSAPWRDDENLFRPGVDFLLAKDERQMEEHLRAVVLDEGLAQSLAHHGLETIRTRHSCAHRVDELLQIIASLEPGRRVESGAPQAPLIAEASA